MKLCDRVQTSGTLRRGKHGLRRFLEFLYPSDDDPGMFTFKMHQAVHLRHVHLHEKMLKIANY